MNKKIQNKILNLRKDILNYNHQYYNLYNSDISDYEFDMMLNNLIKLEKEYPEFYDKNSPTQKLGENINYNTKSILHKYRMYSLNNSYSKEDLLLFDNRIKKYIGFNPEYICELKYDGVSISLKYINQKFIYAVTRGDGFRGEDVTKNIKNIKNIPFKLKKKFLDEFDIRGEIILPISSFKKINNERKKNGLSLYSNPRNTVSGTLKLENKNLEIEKRELKCFIYSISADNIILKSQLEFLDVSSELGFEVPQHFKCCHSITEVFDFINFWNYNRSNLDYEIDGIVIKVNNFNYQKKIGYTEKSPRWAIAFKFKPKEVTTVLRSISYQVGRTGIITPVANLEPILLSGTIVKRASIYNEQFINKLDLHINDLVTVEKGGEIIPKITNVLTKNRPINATKVKFIKLCPACNSILIKKKKLQHYCINSIKCQPQIIGKIEHFVSRSAMNIQGIGNETIKLLVKKKIIQNYADLYKLKKENLINLYGIKEKSINKILDSIKKSKFRSLDKILFGLGIPGIGVSISKTIAQEINSIDDLYLKKKEDLTKIKDIGEEVANNILYFFKNQENLSIIESLKLFGIQISSNSYKSIIFSPIKEKIFLFTGKLINFSRGEAKDIIEKHGGINTNSISKKLNYLVVGENPGIKLNKIKNLKFVKILYENDFLKLLKI